MKLSPPEMQKRKAEKILTTVTILLVAALGIAGFMVMEQTAESNKVTADIAKAQSKNKSRVVREVNLLTVEIKNLQKDMSRILLLVEEIEKSNKEKD